MSASRLDGRFFAGAVKYFWAMRSKQGVSASGGEGRGRQVRGGRQMDGFAAAIFELLRKSGVGPGDIFTRCELHKTGRLELPGYFRPTKQWDMLIVREHRLLAAVELKSQVGPSFGNNFNNRTEEAMGSALDLWTAYRNGALGKAPQPWLGYLFLLEECAESTSPVKPPEPHFEVFPEFKAASYATRYEWLCRKLVRERHYQAACLLLSPSKQGLSNGSCREAAPDLSISSFLDCLLRHVV
jgi:hypothetical protein